jgi:hypothetical protein
MRMPSPVDVTVLVEERSRREGATLANNPEADG